MKSQAPGRQRAAGGLGYRSKAGRVESEGQIAGMRSRGSATHRALGRGLRIGRITPRVLDLSCCLTWGSSHGKGSGKALQGRTVFVEKEKQSSYWGLWA